MLGNFVFANDYFYQVAGYSPEELEGKNSEWIIHREEVGKWKKNIRLYQNGSGNSYTEELRMTTKSGIHVWSQWDFKCLVNEHNSPVGILMVGAALAPFTKQRLKDEATLHAQELRQEEIARELHDNVNQLLATAALLTDAAISSTVSKEEILPRIAMLVRNAITEIRTLSKSLLPLTLDDKTLREALQDLQKNINDSGVIRLVLDIDAEREPDNNRDIKLAVYRIIQELLTNTLKHACATTFSIQLSWTEAGIRLLTKDNGSGFDPSQKVDGIGLRNIRSRLSLLSGTMDIQSSPGYGTSFLIKIPDDKITQCPEV